MTPLKAFRQSEYKIIYLRTVTLTDRQIREQVFEYQAGVTQSLSSMSICMLLCLLSLKVLHHL